MGPEGAGRAALLARAVGQLMAPEAHALSEPENERIYRERIRSLVLPDELQSLEQPTFVMLGGQPGAGKTGLLTTSRDELRGQGATISVVGDDLRSFHPGYRSLQRRDPEHAAFLTNPDASRWVERLLEDARERRVNVVLETTMRQPDNVERIMTAFREAGYRTEARVIAVNERESWQRVHLRYEAMIAAGAAPRFTVKAVHDAAAVGMITSLERIEEKGLADRVEVRRATGETTFVNEQKNGQWVKPKRAADVVLEERDGLPSAEDLRRFMEGWEKVIEKMASRQAASSEVERVRLQAREDREHLDELRTRDAQRHIGAEEVLVPARRVAPLTEPEIDERLSRSVELGERREAIFRSARLVYGEEATTIAGALLVDAARSPQAARAIGNTVLAEPEHYGDLVGERRAVLRRETHDRQAARAALPRLAEQIEDYGAAVARERRAVLEEHAREQHRQSQAVVLSSPLREVLAAPERHQERRLAGGGGRGTAERAGPLSRGIAPAFLAGRSCCRLPRSYGCPSSGPAPWCERGKARRHRLPASV